MWFIITCWWYLYRFQKDSLSDKTNATITSSSCSQTTKDNVTTYKCNIKLSYNINGVDYNNTLNTSSKTAYVNGDRINIKYNPQNHMEISEDTSTITLGIVLIIVSLLMIGGVWLWNYMTQKYEAVATYGAISDVAGIFQSRR